ncbi:MAG: hypothetical protein R2784_11470 [Saprospiraceae bacterium]
MHSALHDVKSNLRRIQRSIKNVTGVDYTDPDGNIIKAHNVK